MATGQFDVHRLPLRTAARAAAKAQPSVATTIPTGPRAEGSDVAAVVGSCWRRNPISWSVLRIRGYRTKVRGAFLALTTARRRAVRAVRPRGPARL